MKRTFTVLKKITLSPAIYKISIKGSDKIYIGETVNLSQRLQKHFSKLRNNSHSNPILQNLFNKYGEENFQIDVIEYLDTKDKLTLRTKEMYYQLLEPNCISMDSNEINVVPKTEEQLQKCINTLNLVRESGLEKCRKPVIIYNIVTREHTLYNQTSDVNDFFEYKHLCKNLKDKTLIPYGDLVAFYPDDFTEENISKIVTSCGMTTNKGDYRLYNIMTEEVLYFSSKSQFSVYINNKRIDDLYDRYNNLIDEFFRCIKNITTLEEFFSCNFIFSHKKTCIKICNLKIYYDALKSHKTNIETAKKMGVERRYIKQLFDEKPLDKRIKEIDAAIARLKSV